MVGVVRDRTDGTARQHGRNDLDAASARSFCNTSDAVDEVVVNRSLTALTDSARWGDMDDVQVRFVPLRKGQHPR